MLRRILEFNKEEAEEDRESDIIKTIIIYALHEIPR
jgi:hypothetical protein